MLIGEILERDISLKFSEWASIQKRLDSLESWKEQKLADDILIQKKIRELFSSYQDEINALSAQLRALKEASHNNVALSPPPHHVAVAKNGPTATAKNIFVKIAVSGSSEIHEFPTDENGNLQVESVVAVYQGQLYTMARVYKCLVW